MYYQKSDAIIFVYDITNIESFNNLKNLYNEVKQTIDLNRIKIFVVGNKNDQYEYEQVKKGVAEQYAKSINATLRIVSALKVDGGINELFDCVAKSFFVNNDDKDTNENDTYGKEESKKSFSIGPDKNQNEKNEKKKCC